MDRYTSVKLVRPEPSGMLQNGCCHQIETGDSVLVDPEILRAFAGHVDRVSGQIADAAVGHTITSAADGVSGSTTQWATRSIGEHFAQVADGLAQNVARMSEAVRGAGDTFEVTDTSLATNFDGLF